MGAARGAARVKLMRAAPHAPPRRNVLVLGLAFKENCPDLRNSM
jgi:UDP-N-acetyl-D-mannosaminuronate dehydrogenase